MIVADTNLIAYLHIPGERTAAAEEVLRLDPEWHAPLLWRSEFRSVLSAYLRREELAVADALELARIAEGLLAGREHLVSAADVLGLAASSGRSAYDCEFAAVARALDAPLVTSDRAVLDAFPDVAVAPEGFAG